MLERFLAILSGLIYRHRWHFIWPQVTLAALSIIYTSQSLGFKTDRSDLVGAEKEYHRLFLEYVKEFPNQDDMAVVVESDSIEKNRQFVLRLGRRLEAETNMFRGVFYRRDLQSLGNKSLLLADVESLKKIRSALREFQPFLENFASVTNLQSLFSQINDHFRTARERSAAQQESLIGSLPVLEQILSQATYSLRNPGMPPPPALAAAIMSPEAIQEMHITYLNGRIFLVVAQPADAKKPTPAIERLRKLVDEVRREVPGVSVGVTGEQVLAFDEMEQAQTDTMWASVLSILGVALVFIISYRETGRPLKAVLSLGFGLCYTMAFTTATVGSLNILTITFLPIVVGMAIDYGVHIVSRYEEELRKGLDEQDAIRIAMSKTGCGVVTGAVTTSAAFFAMGLTDFQGIKDMGIIIGGSLIVCLFPMLTVLPVLLLGGKQNVIDHSLPQVIPLPSRLEVLWLRRPAWTLLIVVGLTGVAALELRHSGKNVDYNLLNLQSQGLPSVEMALKQINQASNSVLFAAVMVDDLDEARALQQAFLKLTNTVAKVESIAMRVGEDASEKVPVIRDIVATIAPMQFSKPDPAAVDVRELSQTLYSFQGYVGAALNVLKDEQKPELVRLLSRLHETITELRREMLSNGEATGQLALFQRALLDEVKYSIGGLGQQVVSDQLAIADLPATLTERFVGVTGRHLLQVYPKGNAWDREVQGKFVAEVRKLAPKVTGTPVQLWEYTDLLMRSYVMAAVYAMAMVLLVVLLQFRSLVCVGLAVLPVVFGAIWTVAVALWLGCPFNPANIMTLPLVVGVGVTNAVHVLIRFEEERSAHILARSTGKAIFVCAMTTMVGFASLMIADHRGISTLGALMTLGTGCCLLGALIVMPTLLSLLGRTGWVLKR